MRGKMAGDLLPSIRHAWDGVELMFRWQIGMHLLELVG